MNSQSALNVPHPEFPLSIFASVLYRPFSNHAIVHCVVVIVEPPFAG
jgi:hypothetical protein